MNYVKIIILLCCNIGFSQTLEQSSIDAGGASNTASNIQLVYSIGETNIQEHSGSFHVSEGFITPSFKIKIDPIVFLQGSSFNPSITGLMNDNLRVNNYIPITSPYGDNATVNASIFTIAGNNAIVDWVWIELRDKDDATKIIRATSAFIQRDGDIVALDGSSSLVLNVLAGNYHVVVKHRNHLSVMSANPIALSKNSTTTVNFTDNSIASFGSNAQVELASTELALWAGNVNGDNIIQYSGTNPDVPSILSEVLNDAGNFLNFPTYIIHGYNVHDVNMDGKTQYTGTEPDVPFILQNVLAHPGNFLNFSTFQIQEQLPEN